MIKLGHKALIIISGLVWFAVGTMLLTIGLDLLVKGSKNERFFEGHSYPVMDTIAPYMGGLEQAALLIVALALIVGYFKGKFVLGKSAIKGIQRIRSFPNPTSLANIYSAKYYILLAAMVALGMSIKYMGVPQDVRGGVDVAIGSALINGAILYFRSAFSVKQPA